MMNEQMGIRDPLYSLWRRPKGGQLPDGRHVQGTDRFLSFHDASRLTAIDIDMDDYCHSCKRSLLFMEIQRGRDEPKDAKVTKLAAQQGKISAFSMSYSPNAAGDDIDCFLVRELYPTLSPVRELDPETYAIWLLSVHEACTCGKGVNP